tara:strand:- start:6806 stop:7153 length:348 start_codon:yes stop_codon:yes gene_type:complete
MGQGFSLSDGNLNTLYEGTATKGASKSITQDGWTITVKNLGPKPNQEMTHQLYSMTVMVNGSQVGKPREITLSPNRGENDKANMRNKINREMNKLQDAMSEAAVNTSSSSTNLKL